MQRCTDLQGLFTPLFPTCRSEPVAPLLKILRWLPATLGMQPLSFVYLSRLMLLTPCSQFMFQTCLLRQSVPSHLLLPLPGPSCHPPVFYSPFLTSLSFGGLAECHFLSEALPASPLQARLVSSLCVLLSLHVSHSCSHMSTSRAPSRGRLSVCPAWVGTQYILDVQHPTNNQYSWSPLQVAKCFSSKLKHIIITRMHAILLPQFTDEETKLPRHLAVLQGHVGAHTFQHAAVVVTCDS